MAAVEEGVVAGGGAALLYATRVLEHKKGANHDQQVGIEIVRRALQAPVRQIAENAGFDGAVVAGACSTRRTSRVDGALLKLGFDVAQSTVAKYLERRRGPLSQGWTTFLRNHAPHITGLPAAINQSRSIA